jgi:hypothetical protein
LADANALREAIRTLDTDRVQAQQFELVQRDLEARDLLATDTWQAADKAMGNALAAFQLREGTEADVGQARHGLMVATEQCRGIEGAKDTNRARSAAHAAKTEADESHLADVMRECVGPLIPGVLADVEHHAQGLGAALRLLYQRDACRNLGTFLSGTAAHQLANSPAWVLEQYGIRAADRMLVPMLREGVDNLKPAQLLAMIDEQF